MDSDISVRFGREPWNPEVVTVEAARVTPDFSRHAHSRAVVGLCLRGGRRMALLGRRLEIAEGGLFVIPADTAHAIAPFGPPPHAHAAVCLPEPARRELVLEGGGGGDGPYEAAARLAVFFELARTRAPDGERRAALAAAMAAVDVWCWSGQGEPETPRPEVVRAAAYLSRRARENPALHETARYAGLSPFHLHRLFTARFGLAPHAYLRRERMRLAVAALTAGESPATAAALAGYADQSHFTRHFRKDVGVTPGRFVRSLKGTPQASSG